MSKFSTRIPVDVEAIRAALPPASSVQSVRLGEDKKSLVVDWESEDWTTPFTVPIEVTPEALRGLAAMPTHITAKTGFKKVQTEDVASKARAVRKQGQ